MIELRKQLPDGRYVFDKAGVIFCVTLDQVCEMMDKIHEFKEQVRQQSNREISKGEKNEN